MEGRISPDGKGGRAEIIWKEKIYLLCISSLQIFSQPACSLPALQNNQNFLTGAQGRNIFSDCQVKSNRLIDMYT